VHNLGQYQTMVSVVASIQAPKVGMPWYLWQLLVEVGLITVRRLLFLFINKEREEPPTQPLALQTGLSRWLELWEQL